MATVTGLTAARMTEIENASVVDGNVVGDNLILTTFGGTNIDAGSVRGATGPTGPAGSGYLVCTSTTRPSLSAGNEGTVIYETDTDLVRVWLGTRWRVQERIIATSTTRPAGLGAADEGVKLYETDTNIEYIWSGTSWLPVIGTPVGSLFPTILTTAPTDHTLCYGQTVTGADVAYPVLWAVVDSAWKSGTSLIIPDLRGRIAVGKDNMGGSTANRITGGFAGINGTVMGATGGNERVHSHNHSTPNHAHDFPFGLTALSAEGSSIIGLAGGGDFSPGFIDTTANDGGGTSGSTGAGSSQNVQPSIILNWILKLR